jgi:hypothetical protein
MELLKIAFPLIFETLPALTPIEQPYIVLSKIEALSAPSVLIPG